MARVEVARLETKATTFGYVCAALQTVNFIIFGLRSISFGLEALSTNQLQGMTPVVAIILTWLTLTVLFGVGMIIGRETVMVKYTEDPKTGDDEENPEGVAEKINKRMQPVRTFSSRHNS